MSQELLTRLWALTLIVSASVLLVLLVRPLLRRLGGACLVYASWLLVPLVLLASALPQPAQLTLPLATAPVQWILTDASTLPALPAERTDLWAMLWLAGVLIATLTFTAQQFHFQQRLGQLQRLGDSVRHMASSSFSGPLLVGLMRPRIVLPADFFTRYNALEQELILAHEAVHLRRHDGAANLLTTLLQTVFWFNPLLHFAARRVRLDQELACDAAVMAQHPDSRSAYASAILKAALIESSAPLACHWQSRHPLKERILELTRTPPARARRLAARALLSALALGACYTAWATSDRAPPAIPLPVQAVAESVAEAVLPVPATANSTASEARVTPSPASTPKPAKLLPVRSDGAQAPARPPADQIADATAAAPPVAAPSATATVNATNVPAQAAGRYKLEFDITTFTQVNEASRPSTGNAALPIRSGERTQINFKIGEGWGARCALDLMPTTQPGEMVLLELSLDCGGQTSSPRLLTQIGKKASIRVGDATKYIQVDMLVTQ